MSHTLYEEAIADAKKLKQMAEEDAKNRIIDAITPRIRQLIEKKILGEDALEMAIDDLDSDPASDDASAPPEMAMPDPDGASGVQDKPVVKIDPDGPVSVDLGDFEVEFGSDDSDDDIVLDGEMAEIFKRSLGVSDQNLSEAVQDLSEKVVLVKEALQISRETGTTEQKKKVTNLVQHVQDILRLD